MASPDCGGCEICCLPCIALFACFACFSRGPTEPCFPCCRPLMRLFTKPRKPTTDPELDRYAHEVEREMALQRGMVQTQPDPNAMPVLPKIKNPVMRDRKEGQEGRDRRRDGERSRSRPHGDRTDRDHRAERTSGSGRSRGDRGDREVRRDERERERDRERRWEDEESGNRRSQYQQGSSSSRRDQLPYHPSEYPNNDPRTSRYAPDNHQDLRMTHYQPDPTYPAHRPGKYSQDDREPGREGYLGHQQGQLSQESSYEGPRERGLMPNPYGEDPRQSQYDRHSGRFDYPPNPYPDSRRERSPTVPVSDYPRPPEDTWAGATGRTRDMAMSSDPDSRHLRVETSERRRDPRGYPLANIPVVAPRP